MLLLYLYIGTYPRPFIFFVDFVKEEAGNFFNNWKATEETTIYPGFAVEQCLDVVLTASPINENCGLWKPMTPIITFP